MRIVQYIRAMFRRLRRCGNTFPYLSRAPRGGMRNMLAYLVAGRIGKSALALWDEDYYRKVHLQAVEEPDLLAFHVDRGAEIRCSPHPALCAPYHALKNCAKSYWGRDVLLACLVDGEEPTALDFHGRPPAGKPFTVKELAQVRQTDTAEPNGIPILTSLAPNRLHEQRQAIDTWLRQGFLPVAVNYPDEIDRLRPHFPDLEFVPALRDSRPVLGRSRVLLHDVYDYAKSLSKNSPHGIVGIVNSDVGLYALEIPALLRTAAGGLLFSRRVEVAAHVHEAGTVYDSGYDAMFFTPESLPDFTEQPFALGETWWDLVFPLHALLRGVPATIAVPALCFHVEHAVNWSEESWHAMGRAAFEFLCPYFSLKRKSCPEFFDVLSNAKIHMHHPLAFLQEFARIGNYILNTNPDVSDIVKRT